MEQLLDARAEEAGEADRERQGGQVAAGLDGVDGLSRDAQRGRQRALAELARGAEVADVVVHRCKASLTLCECQVCFTWGRQRRVPARDYPGRPTMRVLLTNDDGIEAEGLQTMRRALLRVPGIELAVIAPDGNRSAFARMITTRRPLWVQEVGFDDGTSGYATDGTPVDCVRLAKLGLIEGFEADLVVSGINHGSNLGDDITYSGTVAAALEALLLGVPGIAVSQQSTAREMDFRVGATFDFSTAARFVARVVGEIEEVPLPAGTLLNVNVPAGEVEGVEVTSLGKRVYRDKLELEDDQGD